MKRSARSRRVRAFALLGLIAAGALLGACASPVEAVRVERKAAYRELMRSAVTTGDPSWATRDVLVERGLRDAWKARPEEALAALHGIMVAEDGAPELLAALAELSFLHGEVNGLRQHHLAAAVYAWAFLFPAGDGVPRPNGFDPRVRLAADLYNWSLTAAFASQDGSEFVPHAAEIQLPFGPIAVAFDPDELRAGTRDLYGFVPVAELEVKGLAMRYRRPGIGAPLAAGIRPVPGGPAANDLVAPRLKVPLTALLRLPDARRRIVAGKPLEAELELHLGWDDEEVRIAGETVALESEPSAALAYTFTDIPIVEIELLGFLGRLTGVFQDRPPLVSTTPYKPGLIPVVFVHGTASSIVRWAELFNRLQADPELRSRYQFWFFQYDSDNPIGLSALRLRDALRDAVTRLDPDGADPALRRMVLIGHSQGGLLVKMQAIHSGDTIWNAVSRKPLSELRLTDETRTLLERGLFVDPLPEVSRVVFIATPHRGSFVAARRVIQNLMRRLTHLPMQVTRLSADLARNVDATRSPFLPTAVDNMSPHSPFIQGLQQVPVAPSISSHSIIAVDTKGPVEEGNDGVVEYRSAHIDEAASEVIVPSPHSCQGHPVTMEEVRRILRLHAGAPLGGGPSPP